MLPRSVVLPALLLIASGAHSSPRRGIFYAPAIGREYLVFVRGTELWRVPRQGGVAKNLGVPANPNSLPKFSPDGRTISLLTSFDGAYELGTVSVDGGEVRRVTHYPRNGKGLMQWLPSGRLLYFTESDFRVVASQIYTVDAKGGLPQKLPVPYGAECSLSANGEWLAYTLQLRRDLYWKHYAGGMAPDIWLYNLRSGKSKRVTTWKGYDQKPMWRGDRLYYLSDDGPERTMNVWVYDSKTERRRQVTHHARVDIQSPSMSLETGEIAYQFGGGIRVLDLEAEKEREISIEIPAAAQEVASRKVDASRWIVSRTLSPSGDRVVTEARGDLWISPASGGTPRNITTTDAAFERDPAWSPDGKQIACFSDESGEYQLTLIDPETGSRTRVTDFKAGFRQTPRWSPNSRFVAFTDDAGRLFVCDVSSRKVKQFDKDPLGQVNQLSWSPDSRWIAYPKYGTNQQTAIWIYDVEMSKARQATRGFVSDNSPVFDPSGNYLYYSSVRDLSRRINQVMDRLTVYPTPVVLLAVPLRAGPPGPGPGRFTMRSKVEIDFAGFEGRSVPLPLPSGRFSAISAAPGALFIHRTDPLSTPALQMLDLEEGGPAQTVLEGLDGYELSAEGSKLLALKDGKAFVLDAKPNQTLGDEVVSTGFDTTIDPIREWGQISRDVWRLFRDYFYDPKMHGLDWSAQWRRFQPMLGQVASRGDLNYVLGEMISDLSVGHAMMTGEGDITSDPWNAPGQLGVDFELTNGAYRIAKVYRGAPWDPAGRGPLSEPGNEVKTGEYLLAVNGKAIDTKQDPWAAFMGLAGKSVSLTVGPNPKIDGRSRTVTVKTLGRESDLRLRDWVERNRQYVDKASGGKLGYLYLPDEAPAGNAEFVRQFYGQLDKQGLVLDVRWNTGGSSSDRMIEMLNRPLLNAYTERYTTQSFPVPNNRIGGPKALLINRVTSSSGENFAYYFRKAGLGKLIGTRTWGGLIGVNGNQALIDGGFWWIPQAAFFIDQNRWMPEGEGVAPDIEVMDDPALMRNGKDPQLDAAIRHLLGEIRKSPLKAILPPKVRRY